MTVLNTLKRNTLVSIALGALMITSFGTGNAEATGSMKEKWNSAGQKAKSIGHKLDCKASCNRFTLWQFEENLNWCASHCDISTIKGLLIDRCNKLSPENKTKLEEVLNKESEILQHKRSSMQKTTKGFDKKQRKLTANINKLSAKMEKCKMTMIMTEPMPSEPEAQEEIAQEPTKAAADLSRAPTPLLSKTPLKAGGSPLPPPYTPSGAPSSTTTAALRASKAPTAIAPTAKLQDRNQELLSELNTNSPRARLKKVQLDQIKDTSGVSGAGTVQGTNRPTAPAQLTTKPKPQDGSIPLPVLKSTSGAPGTRKAADLPLPPMPSAPPAPALTTTPPGPLKPRPPASPRNTPTAKSVMSPEPSPTPTFRPTAPKSPKTPTKPDMPLEPQETSNIPTPPPAPPFTLSEPVKPMPFKGASPKAAPTKPNLSENDSKGASQKPGDRGNLLDALQDPNNKVKLKKVETNAPKPTSQPQNTLQGALAQAMANRNKAVQSEDPETDDTDWD